jgi:hypothetical protein
MYAVDYEGTKGTEIEARSLVAALLLIATIFSTNT